MSAQILLERRVGELVAEDFRNAHVFSRFGIDFCCGGGRSLASACERAGAEPTEVLHALSQLAAEGTPDDALAKLPLGELIEHIEATHHKYIRDTAPLLLEYAQKMVRAHGEHYEEIKPLAGWIRALMDDLLPHLQKEEQILFPAIRALSQGQEFNACFGHIGNPIRAMEYEHDEAGQILAKLQQLTNHYQAPEHACTTWRVCYATLAEFEADLHRHIHLENNLLFPKALALVN
ncbi:iron-sulfur cluster repair di-iron protein [Shewanella carassii]|uniref:Iron-sulfur cluster repair di-iron protein n=1 Tax=Shewanella carassii TaxID=1987584 RepID=A0ABQ1TG22_9GAMM|nr:iron-sulfur cluster repair di-iron protein [Shewanella carassii]BCV68162.1 iron-sulfur cluster repair di-iron protein [Shewanella carassii]GGE92281.1 iron-sulfur cluster repair di-iron protein [Shewanella carassii]